MATNNVAPVAMPGKASNRTDRGLVQRVQKVQRDARLNRAAGGEYNARNSMNATMVGTNIPTTASAVSQDVTMPTNVTARNLPPVDVFAPGSALQGAPYSDGAPIGPGRSYSNVPNIQFPDSGSALARAMLLQNPTNPQLVAIVQAYNEAGL